MEVVEYFMSRNETLTQHPGLSILDIESIAWERTHYSPFTDLYILHLKLTGDLSNGTGFPILKTAITHNAHEYVRFYIEFVALMIVAIGGIIGNILSACVLLSTQMRSPITYLLLGMALTDLLMIFNGILAIAVPSFCIYFKIDLLHYKFITLLPIMFAVGPTAHLASVLYALCITLERYFAVKNPIKARTLCTLQRAKFTSVAVFIFSVLYSLPRWFEFTYIKVPFDVEDDVDEDDFYYLPVTGALRKNLSYVKFMYSIHFVFFYIIPMVLIIYFNIRTYFQVKFANKERETMTISQTSESYITTMLLIIVVVFVACNILPLANLFSKLLTGNPEIFVLDSIRNFLWIFNSSINFVIYYAYSERFRETCLRLWPICFHNTLCCNIRRKKRHPLKYASKLTFKSSNSSQYSVNTVATTLGNIKESWGGDRIEDRKQDNPPMLLPV